MEELAILDGKPLLKEPLPRTNNIGDEEKNAVLRVLDSGILSDYVGRAGDKFLGGKEVLSLEQAFKDKFGCKFAVSFNSATTALDAAVCALGIGPGDEVIVSPYTMSASATAILMNMAIPIFADIEEDTFCLDPKSVKERISEKTKAILITNIFGGSARYDKIISIAKEHKLKIIEDNAQAPGGIYKDKYLATIGDIGVFSLNFHKVIHCGEGGVLVTNNKKYAYRAQLKRNHGEAVLDDLNNTEEAVLGSNYRLTEVHAAIASEQLKKLDMLNRRRIELANHLTQELEKIEGITPTFVLPDTKHVYYVYPLLFDSSKFGISRDLFFKAMEKEGFVLNQGYLKPLYLMPLFRNQKIFPNRDCPFGCKYVDKKPNYQQGLCPTAERLWKDQLILTTICRHPLDKKHIDIFISAIKKIKSQVNKLVMLKTKK